MGKALHKPASGLLLAAVILFGLASPAADVFAKAEEGTTYYVAADGKDDNEGTSPNSPWSFARASVMSLKGGERILLKRGDVFYGTLNPTTYQAGDSNRAEIGAYGTGALPRVSLAKIVDKKWMKSAGGFYRYNIGASGTYGGLQNGVTDIGFMEDASGKKWGVRKQDENACTNEYDFYCDNTYIYVKTTQDPNQKLGKLTLGVTGTILRVSNYLNVHDLHLKYSGGHGINLQKAGVGHVRVYDCVVEDIGGGRLGTTGWTKYGNGIEFYGSASNMLVERCIIRNTYDVGFTLQGGGSCSWKDVTVRNNLFAYNTQSVEIWTSGTSAGQGIDGLSFTENLCINQGEGWGTPARPDLVGGGGQIKMTDVLVYGYTAPVLNMTITGNTFYNRNEANRTYSVSTTGNFFFDRVKIDKNHIYLPKASSICMSTDKSGGKHGNKSLRFSQWQSEYQQDKNSTFTAGGGGSQYASMEKLALTSLSFNEVLAAAKAAGLKVNASPIPATTATQPPATAAPTKSTARQTKASTKPADPGVTTGSAPGESTAGTETGPETTGQSGASSSAAALPEESGGGLPVWAIVLIAVGSAAVLGGGAALYFLVIKKKQS